MIRGVGAAAVVASGLVLLLAVGPARAELAPRGIDVRVPDHLAVTVGASASLEISIAVDRGLVVSKDAPVIVDVAGGPGIAIKKHRLGRTDAVDPGADAPRFALPTRGEVAGDTTVDLRIRLWLCGGRICRPVDVRRRVQVAVTAADPATVAPLPPPPP